MGLVELLSVCPGSSLCPKQRGMNIQHKQMASLHWALCCKAHPSSVCVLLPVSGEWWGSAAWVPGPCVPISATAACPGAIHAHIAPATPHKTHLSPASAALGFSLWGLCWGVKEGEQTVSIQLFPLLLLRTGSAFLIALQESRRVWSGALHGCAGLSSRCVFGKKCWVQQPVNADLCALLSFTHTPPHPHCSPFLPSPSGTSTVAQLFRF